MKGHVKLTTAEHRAWRVNKAQWVSRKGVVLRAVTPEEEKAIFPITERVKRTGRSETLPTKVVYKVQGPQGQVVEQAHDMDVMVRATRTGRDAQAFLLDVFVNGNRYVKGREIIAKRMLARHGECILFQPNGKRLIVVRNPKIARPTYSESQRAAPHPDHCPCRAFSDRREPGRHHIACEWNSKAPPHEQATPLVIEQPATALIDSPEPLEALAFDPAVVAPGGADRFGRQVMAGSPPPARYAPPPPPSSSEAVAPPSVAYGVRAAARAGVAIAEPLAPAQANQHPTLGAPMYAVVPSSPALTTSTLAQNPRRGTLEVYSPEQCPEDCRGMRDPAMAWKWPVGRRMDRGHHHPLCPHEGAYQQRFGAGRRWVLYDIERKVEVREATVQEVAQSEVELQRSGTRSLTLGGRIYAVVPTRPVAAVAPVAAAPRRAETAAEFELDRQQALEVSGLPTVPVAARPTVVVRGPAEDPMSELERLRARVLELERGATLAAPVGPGTYYEPAAPSYQHAALEPRPVGTAADHLRAPNGLIGNQLIGDDIPQGEVQLFDPEPFVDPLPAMQVARPVAPAPYHPGVVHAGGFVPPPPPEERDEPAAVEVAAEPPPFIEAGGPSPDEEDDDSDEEDEESPIAAEVLAIAGAELAAMTTAASSIASGA